MRNLVGLGICAIFCFAGFAVSQEAKRFDHELYPLQVGNKWTYRAGAEKVHIQVVKEENFTRKMKGADGKESNVTIAGYLLNVSSGNKILQEHVAVMEEGIYRLSAAGKQIQPPLCFFVKDAKPGDSWRIEATSEGTSLKGLFYYSRSRIRVPMGEFITDVVTSKDFESGDQKMEVESWYAKDIGMVKQRVRYGTNETILELESFTRGK